MQWSPKTRQHKVSHNMTKSTKLMCAQRRLRSAWTSALSDQSLRCALSGKLRTQAFFMRTATSLIRLGGCCYFVGFSMSQLKSNSTRGKPRGQLFPVGIHQAILNKINKSSKTNRKWTHDYNQNKECCFFFTRGCMSILGFSYFWTEL